MVVTAMQEECPDQRFIVTKQAISFPCSVDLVSPSCCSWTSSFITSAFTFVEFAWRSVED